MSVSINGTNGVTFNDGSVQTTSALTGFRNRIINGDMRIDQRNAGASVTASTATYCLDRWHMAYSAGGKYSVQQNAGSTTPPLGFKNYLGCTSLSAYAVSSGDYFAVGQIIEGLNVEDLAWGTANAKTVTLSFRVYSSLTGTFGGALQNSDGTRCYPFSYSISAANTWTTVSVTIAGDTSGTWLTNNGIGVKVYFSFGTGTTYSGTAGSWAGTTYISATGAISVVGTNGATFYITGVQLEAGSTATEFERRPYGTELALCQRYYWQMSSAGITKIFFQGYMYSSAQLEGLVPFPVQMRGFPTMTSSSASSFSLRLSSVVINNLYSYATTEGAFTSMLLYTSNPTVAGVGTGFGQSLISNSANPTFIGFSSEL